jgi:hypothetical protein
MVGSLLRTGTARDYHPLGAVGNPVYLSAPQLRAAIARRLGQVVADILAIPQRNEDGDTIDWYAPVPGPVVPWSAATPDERARAKAALADARGAIEKLATAMQAEVRSDHQVFGRLLEQVTAFPNDEHLYLVNDRPVMTFWGFQGQDVPAGGDALIDLPTPPTPPVPVAVPPKRHRRWWWLLPLLLLLLALIAAYLLLREPEPVETPIVPTPTEVLPPASDAASDSAATPEGEPAPDHQPEGPEPAPATPLQERRDLRIQDSETRVHDTDHWVVGPDGRVIERDVTRSGGTAVPSGTTETAPAGATAGSTDQTDTTAPAPDQPPPATEPPKGETEVAAPDEQAEAKDLPEPAEATSDVEASKPEAEGPTSEPDQGPETKDLQTPGETAPDMETPKPKTEPPPSGLDQQTEPPSSQEPTETTSDSETPKPENDGQTPDLTQPPETKPETPPDETRGPEQKPEGTADKPEEKADQLPPEKPAPELTQEPESPPPGQPKGPESRDKEGKPEQPAPDLTRKPAPADARSAPKPSGKPPQTQRSGAGSPGKAAEPLRIPAEAMASGSTRFLNGGWRTATSLQDPSTSLPVEMSYRLENGAGQVQLKRYDGSLCTAGAQAAMRSGKLVIDSANDIRCPDGANFGRPRMECAPGKDGKADCAGHYATGESFSVDLNRAQGSALKKGAGDPSTTP